MFSQVAGQTAPALALFKGSLFQIEPEHTGNQRPSQCTQLFGTIKTVITSVRPMMSSAALRHSTFTKEFCLYWLEPEAMRENQSTIRLGTNWWEISASTADTP